MASRGAGCVGQQTAAATSQRFGMPKTFTDDELACALNAPAPRLKSEFHGDEAAWAAYQDGWVESWRGPTSADDQALPPRSNKRARETSWDARKQKYGRLIAEANRRGAAFALQALVQPPLTSQSAPPPQAALAAGARVPICSLVARDCVCREVVTTHSRPVGANGLGTAPDGFASLTMGLNALPRLAVAMNRLLHEGQLQQLQQLASRLDAVANSRSHGV